LYGRAPGPIDPEIQRLCIGDETPLTGRPADSLEPELPKRRAELEERGIAFSEEDLMSYALFPQVALEFFERRDRETRPKEELVSLVAVIADLLPGDDTGEAIERPPALDVQPVGETAWAKAARRDLVGGGGSWRY
jgi:pyruvate carboxylase